MNPIVSRAVQPSTVSSYFSRDARPDRRCPRVAVAVAGIAAVAVAVRFDHAGGGDEPVLGLEVDEPHALRVAADPGDGGRGDADDHALFADEHQPVVLADASDTDDAAVAGRGADVQPPLAAA